MYRMQIPANRWWLNISLYSRQQHRFDQLWPGTGIIRWSHPKPSGGVGCVTPSRAYA